MWPDIVPGLVFPKTFGLVIMIGALFSIWLAAKRGERFGLDKEKIWDFSVAMVLCGILGARAAEVIVEWDYYWEPFSKETIGFGEFLISLIAIWRGGLTFYGGFILSALVAFYLIRKWGLPFSSFVGVLVPTLALGHSIGRIACFFQGCCYGSECSYPWGVVFPGSAPVYHDPGLFIAAGTAVHPTQLYESLGLFVIFLILSWLLYRVKNPGSLLFTYLFLYGTLRFVVEFWRVDTQDMALFSYQLHVSQWIGLVMILIGTAGFIFLSGRRNNQ